MTRNISEEDVHQAIGQVMHPEINRTLVELGMVKDIVLKDGEVTLTLALPFLGIPVSVKDYLTNSLRQAVMKLVWLSWLWDKRAGKEYNKQQ